MAGERELKLGASPGFHLPDLNSAIPGVVASEPEERRIEATYYDTPDLGLARAGSSLRHQAGGGWTLTLPEAGQLEFDGRPNEPPAEAVRLVTAFRRSAELRPVARLSTWRRRVRLQDESGAELGAVTDDEVSVLEGRRVAARFREVEVALSNGTAPEVLDLLRDRLLAVGAGEQETLPVHIRALGPPALRPPEVRALPTDANATAGDAVRAGLAKAIESLLASDPGVRLGQDPDHIRRIRVAARRLRSHLRTFAPLLDPEWSSRLAGELSWLAGELGAVRDLEVAAARLRQRASEVSQVDRQAALALAALPAAEAVGERRRLAATFDSPRYVELLELLVEAATAPPLTGDKDVPASEMLPQLARTPWKKLRKAASDIGHSPSGEELHGVRVRAKRARYAAELAGLAGADSGAYVAALSSVQDVLGEHQDSAAVQEWLRAHAGSGRRAFVAGQLYQLELAAAGRAFAAFPAAWQAARRGRLRKWMP
jgi:CHAD domain-containing protein